MKTRSKQPLGYLPLDIELLGPVNYFFQFPATPCGGADELARQEHHHHQPGQDLGLQQEQHRGNSNVGKFDCVPLDAPAR